MAQQAQSSVAARALMASAAAALRRQALSSLSSSSSSSSSRAYGTDLAPFSALRSSLGERGGSGGRSSTSGVTVTVFGASGFLGRYVCNALARAGHRLVLPYRCDDLEVQHLRPLGDLGQVVMLPGFDVRSEEAIARATEASTVVFNLIGAKRATRNFSLKDVNVDAAERVARVSSKSPAGVERFVHFSCVGAGTTSPSERLRTKAAGEAAVKSAFRGGGGGGAGAGSSSSGSSGATILRLGPCVGIEDSTLNAVAQLAKAMPAVPLIGGGAQRWQPVAAADVGAAAAATLRSPVASGKIYELVGPKTYSFKELVNLVLDTMREPRSTVYVPEAVADLVAKIPLGPLRHPWFSADAVAEAVGSRGSGVGIGGADLVAGGTGSPPASSRGSLADLGVSATPIEDAIDHLRWLRAGGYDVGTLSENASTGGAGFGAKVA